MPSILSAKFENCAILLISWSVIRRRLTVTKLVHLCKIAKESIKSTSKTNLVFLNLALYLCHFKAKYDLNLKSKVDSVDNSILENLKP